MIDLSGVGMKHRNFELNGRSLLFYHSIGDLWIVSEWDGSSTRKNFYFLLPKESENKLFPITEAPVPFGTRPGLNRRMIEEHLDETEIVFGFPTYSIVKGVDSETFYLMRSSEEAPYKVEMFRKIPSGKSVLIFNEGVFLDFASYPTLVPFADGKLYPSIN